uniref:CCHC-type domain-containing protein n=1 Tax=Meloidogyne incognita TaxID=6306 RepID=A0A914MKQ9_MELIC
MEIAEQARGVLNEIEYLLAEPDEASSQASQGSRRTLTETEQQEQHQSVLEHQSVHSEQINQHFNHQPNQQINQQLNQQPYQQVNNQFNQQQYQQVNYQQNQQQYQQVNQEFNQQQVSRFQPDIRLPELRLDPFNGDPKKWPTFWQLFSANIDQRPMDNIRKMSYLLTFLQGPAKELVAGFVLSNENYTRALDLLKSRYGDSRAITEALEAELMNLHPANESTYSLRGFVDNIERICRQLEAYGHVDSSPFVSTAIKSKLPQQIVAKLIEKERGSGIRWNCAQLRKELREIVEIKEEVQRCSTVTRVRQEITNPPAQRNKVAQKGRPPELTRSFGAPIQSRQENRRPFRGPRRCSLCDIVGHLPSQCPKYPTPQDRFRRLRAQNRCVRCLNEGHTSRDCHSFKICGQCQGGHHMLVCTKGRDNKGPQANTRPENKHKPQRQFTQMAAASEKGPATGSNLTEPSGDIEQVQPEKSITAMAYSHLRKKLTAYLMTRKIAIASPKEPNKEIPAFVFFDPGSQLSYIVKSLVKQIRPPQIARDDVEVHGFGGTLRDPIRIRSPSYAISIQREDGEWEEVELNWTKEISTSFEMANWVAEMPTQVADFPEIQKAIELSTEVPGIMLGTRHFWKYFMGRTEVAPGLFVIQTAFGPVVGGESDMSHLDRYGPGVASELANGLYVDNLHLGAETWPELLDKCRRAKDIFSDASMNLREFSSNSSKLMNAIPEKDCLDSKEPKVLGMRWNINTDSLSFQLPNESMKKNVSRRAVLSSLAGIYDPLGLLSPSVLPAKLFFQKLWDEGHDWDSSLSDEETFVWEKFLKGWQHTNISLPRRALSITPQETEIHTFVDASSCAYAAAVYLRGVNNESISTSLIFAKNRLKPKKGGKTLTIPRMELIAILIGVRATAYVQKEIGVPLTQIHLWSDSQIALSWVRSPQSQPSFVQRRLDEIKKHTNITFHYIRTNENPADLATRGLIPQELNQNRLWWSGPDWLEKSTSSWPEDPTFETFNLKEAITNETRK